MTAAAGALPSSSIALHTVFGPTNSNVNAWIEEHFDLMCQHSPFNWDGGVKGALDVAHYVAYIGWRPPPPCGNEGRRAVWAMYKAIQNRAHEGRPPGGSPPPESVSIKTRTESPIYIDGRPLCHSQRELYVDLFCTGNGYRPPGVSMGALLFHHIALEARAIGKTGLRWHPKPGSVQFWRRMGFQPATATDREEMHPQFRHLQLHTLDLGECLRGTGTEELFRRTYRLGYHDEVDDDAHVLWIQSPPGMVRRRTDEAGNEMHSALDGPGRRWWYEVAQDVGQQWRKSSHHCAHPGRPVLLGNKVDKSQVVAKAGRSQYRTTRWPTYGIGT